MTVFVDPKDDSAYVLYSSEANATLYIAKLNDDYTNVVKTTMWTSPRDKSSTLLTGSTHTFLQTLLRMPVRGEDFQIVRTKWFAGSSCRIPI